MAATPQALQHQSFGSSLLTAFNDNADQKDILQIVNAAGLVVISVSYNGTVNQNPTATNGAGGAGLYTVNKTLIGQFRTRIADAIGSGSTVAQSFASAFPTNPQNLDIFQNVAQGGNATYYLNYLGVGTGS